VFLIEANQQYLLRVHDLNKPLLYYVSHVNSRRVWHGNGYESVDIFSVRSVTATAAS